MTPSLSKDLSDSSKNTDKCHCHFYKKRCIEIFSVPVYTFREIPSNLKWCRIELNSVEKSMFNCVETVSSICYMRPSEYIAQPVF